MPGIKGKTNNPHGRPKNTDYNSEIRHINNTVLNSFFSSILAATFPELKDEVENRINEMPIAKLVFAKAIINELKTGKTDNTRYVIERLFGKAQERIVLDDYDKQYSKEELEKLALKTLAVIERKRAAEKLDKNG